MWGAIVGICCVVALLFAVDRVGSWLEQKDAPPEAHGDLTNRFEELPTVDYDGRTYRMREKQTKILLMGVDRTLDQGAVSGFRNGGQADFLLLLVIDDQQKTITPVQIDRDTMAEITILGVLGNPAGTRSAQICLSHGFGDGAEQSCLLTQDAVSKLLLGVDVDFYIAMNLDGISVLNDLLGGIPVTLEDDFSALDPAMTAGTSLTLRGKQAEYYVRNRMDIGIGTNEARMARQRQYLSRAGEQLAEMLNGNANFAGELFDELEEYLVTDMKRGRMINEAANCRGYARSETITPAGEHAIGADGFMEFHADESALEQLVISLFYEELP